LKAERPVLGSHFASSTIWRITAGKLSVVINGDVAAPMKKTAQQKICQMSVFAGTIFRKLEHIGKK